MEFNSIITLSESGAILWKLMENGSSEDEMVMALLAEYDVDESLVREDVHAFIKDIIDRGICE